MGGTGMVDTDKNVGEVAEEDSKFKCFKILNQVLELSS
jgi:hypothetical protein